jgi:signal transduction histidine kinase/ligand-binding sensor domain-containing protein
MNVRIIFACIGLAIVALGVCGKAAAVDPNRRLDEYAHTIWKTGDEGLFGEPESVAQTTDGYLWVGTSTALFRFDGARFALWGEHDVGRPFDGPVIDLYSSPDGSLWVSTAYKGLTRLKDHRAEAIDRSFRVLGITMDRTGAVWYATYDPLANRHDLCSYGHRDVPHCVRTPQPCITVASLGNTMWCGGETDLFHFDDGQLISLPIAGMESQTSQANVEALLPDDSGGLYVGVSISGRGLGLEQYHGGRLLPFSTGGLDGTKLRVSALFKDREGSIWIGTYQGIYRIHSGQVDYLPMQSQWPVHEFAEDSEGSVWAAGFGGLERFSDKPVVDMNVGEVDGVFVYRSGALWVSGDNTFLMLPEGSKDFTAPTKLPPNSQFTSILEDHNGTKWVGINDSLYTLETRGFKPVTSATGKPLGMIASLAEDTAYNLWAVTLGPPRGILKIDEQSRRVTQIDSLPPASRVAADPAGGVYVAALDGNLVHVDSNGDDRVYSHLDGRSGRTSQLMVAGGGTVYASTPFGLETLRNGKLQIMDSHNGLPCDRVYETAVAHDGSLWLNMQCALVRIPKDEMARWRRNPSAVVRTHIFDAEDGATGGETPFNGVAVTPDGKLWFAGGTDLQQIDPQSILSRNEPPPPVHIEQFAADGHQYPIYGYVRLPALTRDLQIDYSGLSFIAPDKVRFRYKLEGFDANWKDVGARRQAFYTALPPGNYLFRVIASNRDGAWNTVGDRLSFYLAPAFYQTLWFKLLCGALAVGLMWLIFHLRLRQVVAQVRTRQSAQYAERERIARTLHDTLLQSVQGLIWRFSAAAGRVPGELAVHQELQDLVARSDEVLAEARNSILDLREAGNRSLGLTEEISALGKDVVGDSGIQLTVLANGKPYLLNPDTYENAVLIVREALLNAVRHAKAKALEVQIDYLQHELRLCVRDDGAGIDQDTLQHGRAGHWGLLGMRERSKSIHGRLRILSKAGAGTEIELVVPRVYAEK